MITINGEEYDLLDIVHRLGEVDNPVEKFRLATTAIDEVRDHLIVELAAVRREAAVQARQVLIDEQGLKRGEANRELAHLSGTSVQTIARMINEQTAYGVGAGH